MQLLHDVQGRSYKRHSRAGRKSILNTDSFNFSDVTSPHSLDNDTDIMTSQSNIMRTNSHLLHTTSLPKDSFAHKEIASLESEIKSLRAELKETKSQAQADVDKAKQEAIRVMQATGTSLKLCDRPFTCLSVYMSATDHQIVTGLVRSVAFHVSYGHCHPLHLQPALAHLQCTDALVARFLKTVVHSRNVSPKSCSGCMPAAQG